MNKKKKAKYDKQGKRVDRLEVKLRDGFYNPYYKKDVIANNAKELSTIIKELRDRGIPIDKAHSLSILYEDDFSEL